MLWYVSACEGGSVSGAAITVPSLMSFKGLPRSMSIHHFDVNHARYSLAGHGTLENLLPMQPKSVFC
jgi:hypothetical protein